MSEECTCENGKKHEAQLLDVLLANLAAGKPPGESSDLHKIIFGPEGDIDKGLLGKMHRTDLVLVELQSGQKSMRNWLKVGVTMNLFLLSILTAHLSDSPKSALADVPPPPAIEQQAQEPPEGPVNET